MSVTFRDAADSLTANGYAPIPITPYSKRPAIDAWQKYTHTPASKRQFTDNAGIGLLCGYLRGIDIDVMRPDLAREFRAHAESIWGPMPARIGQAPKVLLLARSLAIGHKLFSLRFRFPDDPLGSKAHGIEILGSGQQFVAYGFHPDTRQEYTWNGAGEPMEVPFEQLPVANEDELYGFLQWANNRMLEAGGIPCGKLAQNDSKDRSSNDELDAHNPAECLSAIQSLDNDDLHWDDWIYIGLAIKGALGPASRDAWHTFSQRSDKYNPDLTDRMWHSFKPERIGAGTLYRLAFDKGWERPTYDVDLSGLLGEKKPKTPLLLDVAQLRQSVGPLRWAVKHTIPANSIGSFYGAAGTFKSFVALDLSLHMAHGMEWLEKKTIHGAVVYVAAEGGTGLLARIDAWHQQHELDPKNALFKVCIMPMMLDRPTDLKRLSDAVHEASGDIGEPSLIVLDTMSQTMAGDENEARDTAGYFRGVGGALRARFNCALLIMHHTGHTNGDRPRGSSTIKGNLDFLFSVDRVEGQMTCALTCKKQKDGNDGIVLPFVLERQTLGTDEDGDPITSLVANYHDNAKAILNTPKKRSPNAELLLTILDFTPIRELTIRTVFYGKLIGMEGEAKKKAFQRAFRELSDAGLADKGQGDTWLIPPKQEGTT